MNDKSLVKKLKKTTWEKEKFIRKLVQDKEKKVQHQQTTHAKEEHKNHEQVPHLGIFNPQLLQVHSPSSSLDYDPKWLIKKNLQHTCKTQSST